MANDLKMEVVLQAIDRATRPIRAVTQSSIGLGQALKQSRDSLKQLQATQADVTSFRQAKAASIEQAAALKASQDRVNQLSGALKAHEQAVRPLQTSYDQLKAETTALDTRHKALTQQLRETREQSRAANQVWQENRKRIRELGQQIGNTAEPTQKLRDEYAALVTKQQAQLELVRRLSGSQKELQQQHRASSSSAREQRERLADLSGQLQEARAPMQGLNQEFRTAVRESQTLKTKHSAQGQVLQGLRDKLRAAGISTKSLSEGERQLRTAIASTTQTIGQQEARFKRLAAQQRQLAAAKQGLEKSQALAGSMAANGAGAAAAGAAMGAPVLGAVKSYMSFEDAMLGVAKQVEGARDDNGNLTATYYEMGDAIKAMAERIPMATTDIAALVEGAARMGVQGKENLLSFAEVAANAATAFELPADAIGENLARIADLYKIPIENVSQLGDAINFLDDNAKSKGADIIDVLQRTAGVTASVGMSYKDAAALGSTFLTLGATAETAGTATNAMIRELAIATQQPKRFQSGLKALGMEAKALQEGMTTDSTGTILNVLDAINRLPKKEQLGVATELFGKEFGDDASKLAQNIGEYRRQLELASSAEGDGSMQREADIRAAAMSAKMDMAKNRAFNLAATLGETLRPTLVNLVESFNSVISGVTGWVKANPALTGQIIRVVAGVAVLATGFGAVALAMASLLGPFAMVRYALTLFGIKSLGAVTAFKSLGTALLWVGKAVLFIGRALLMNPIGLAVAAIAGAAYLIYKNWEPIKAFFLGLWTQIQTGFNSGLSGILGLIANFSPIGLFYSAFAAVMNYFGVDLPAQFTGFGSMLIDGLVNGITNKLGAVKEAITGAGESTIGWFKEKLGIHSPSRVFAELGGFTMAGLEQGLAGNQSGPLGAVTNLSKQLTDAGAFAIGAGAQGMDIDNRPPLSAAPPAGQNAGASSSLPPMVFNIHPSAGMDEQALAKLVAAEVAKIQRSNQARSRSALSDGE
ncbi:phage tail tape measure protein [Pseudomonas sp. H9]|uniref:phage tail tape measure protein n=1 Tax=Pseudomonas sp. H9 TaxID=483968 RepID=UPI002115B220|nr:phage tail tape measure protein [Pseudomonas sp. H9]